MANVGKMMSRPDRVIDGSCPNRREKLLAGINIAKLRGLEVAPLSRATLRKSEGDITYIDRNDTVTLIERHRYDPTFDYRDIVPIDVAVELKLLPDALGHLPKFDYIIASHVVEHIPNLVTWFEELRSILNPGGVITLAVPDKRYTFDYLRQETNVTEVLVAYALETRVPLAHCVLDNFLHVRKVSLVDAWERSLTESMLDGFPDQNAIQAVIGAAKDVAANQTYYEVHVWAFTPLTFAKVLQKLAEVDLLHFACAGYFDTEPYTFEFFVRLVVCDDHDRVVASWKDMADALDNGLRCETVEPKGKMERLIAEGERLRAAIVALSDQVTFRDDKIAAIHQSTSWKMTAPLRALSTKMRTIRSP